LIRLIETDYNKLYVHSELDYMSPEGFEQQYKPISVQVLE